MKGYHEYLELFAYFAQPGDAKLSRAEYDSLHAEYLALAAKHPSLDRDERTRLHAVKLLLYRDKP